MNRRVEILEYLEFLGHRKVGGVVTDIRGVQRALTGARWAVIFGLPSTLGGTMGGSVQRALFRRKRLLSDNQIGICDPFVIQSN